MLKDLRATAEGHVNARKGKHGAKDNEIDEAIKRTENAKK